MIIRQLNETQFEKVHTSLKQKAYSEPFDASYTVTMQINGIEYAVRVQPERHNKIAVLQALRIDRSGSEPHYDLITQGQLLSSFLELFLYQEVGR